MPKLLNKLELAESLGVCVRTIERWTQLGLAHIRVNRYIRFLPADVETFLNENRVIVGRKVTEK